VKESDIDMERIIEILKCLEEDNPNSIYSIEYSDDGRSIQIKWLKELLD